MIFPDNTTVSLQDLSFLYSETFKKNDKTYERFYYTSDQGTFPVGKTLHLEFQAKGPNVQVLRTMIGEYAQYKVEKCIWIKATD